MKYVVALAISFSPFISRAVDLPFETESDRLPSAKFNGNVLFTHANILTVTKGNVNDGDLLILNGKIAKIGRGIKAPDGVTTVDLKGKFLMPGIVDTHSHRGLDGVNEGGDSVTPESAVRYFVNPESKNMWQAVASGHTSALLLHGSANAIGGESVVVKYKYRHPVRELIVPDAPRMVKFALGENVTQKGDDTSRRYPKSRMGVESVYRRAFAAAKDYKDRIAKGEKVTRDLRLEALADILDRKIWVQCHSYRSDEMLTTFIFNLKGCSWKNKIFSVLIFIPNSPVRIIFDLYFSFSHFSHLYCKILDH